MKRVGSEAFKELPIERQIKLLVRRGYKSAAFRIKSNADLFAKEWAKKGYKAKGTRSSGPVVEGGFSSKAFYIAVGKG